jgi:hypothetical protein
LYPASAEDRVAAVEYGGLSGSHGTLRLVEGDGREEVRAGHGEVPAVGPAERPSPTTRYLS